MQERLSSSRRRFLKVVGAGSMLGAIPSCGDSSSPPEAFADVSAGKVADTAVGTLRAIPGAPAYLGRDQQGLYAMTSTCPHEGCDMIAEGSVSADGVYCACHGSRFDANGAVLAGPANSPLVHFAVDLDGDGNITVHGGSQVDASVRKTVVG
ncbi:MAG TPA: Rieske (2Fe-2S) protein [Polyangiaceae bacterium]|nr:Rieske (2Fe-2S) protein [Polyangiaceae bacterium]